MHATISESLLYQILSKIKKPSLKQQESRVKESRVNSGSQLWMHIKIIWRALKVLIPETYHQRFGFRWFDVGPRHYNFLKATHVILMCNQN